MDADGIQFLRNTMTENGNCGDVSELRKVARVLEQGKEKASRGLTKEEIQAGLDALWNDGGVEGALVAVEILSKLGSNGKILHRGEKVSVTLDVVFKDGFVPKGTHNDPLLHKKVIKLLETLYQQLVRNQLLKIFLGKMDMFTSLRRIIMLTLIQCMVRKLTFQSKWDFLYKVE